MNSRQKSKEWKIPRHTEFESELRNSSSEWFQKNNFQVHNKMPYCLDSLENWKNNIILAEVAAYIDNFKNESEKKNKPFPLHKYAHHGLSSQAMVFNLIGPLITRNDLNPLTDLLKLKGIDCKINNAHFEYEDRNVFNEDTGQPTSIDLVLFDTEQKPRVFIESKLVEAEFGGCSVFTKGDCAGRNPINDLQECFLHFIGRKYWYLIEKYGFNEKIKNEKICILVNYYQFFREILLSIDKDGYFVLLSDERSPVFNYQKEGKVRGLIPLLREFVPDKYKDRIILVTIQEIVNSIESTNRHNDWINEFKVKYGIK
ncbi:MAG TPA: hypothetical protein PKG96_11005 [Bacilli bacterium]|jgi:hypothetical protein|nr:hypothetical protein [Bacilli bacterium]